MKSRTRVVLGSGIERIRSFSHFKKVIRLLNRHEKELGANSNEIIYETSVTLVKNWLEKTEEKEKIELDPLEELLLKEEKPDNEIPITTH